MAVIVTNRSNTIIPEPYPLPFNGTISHPQLMLWDSWCYKNHGEWNLYCLALSKFSVSGDPIFPKDRNKHQFHVRHFQTQNSGKTWTDLGLFQEPIETQNGYFDRNIWSGSALVVSDAEILFGFTGIRNISEERPFLQSIGLAISSDGKQIDHIQPEPLSCPLRDYDKITDLGYYLGSKDSLGHSEGEEGGPILAWRDPFLVKETDGSIQMVWSAKVSPKEGAMARATLIKSNEGYKIETLHAPVKFPDSHKFTQAEVPKIYYDAQTGHYLCILAACDRLYEGQDDSEVTKVTRLYKSKAIRGPWTALSGNESSVPGLENLFGGSIIKIDHNAREMTMLAPYTEMARPDLELTFAAPITINY